MSQRCWGKGFPGAVFFVSTASTLPTALKVKSSQELTENPVARFEHLRTSFAFIRAIRFLAKNQCPARTPDRYAVLFFDLFPSRKPPEKAWERPGWFFAPETRNPP